MSTKATIFLTNENEHCYYEFNYSIHNGESIIMEAEKRNIEIIDHGDEYEIRFINPKSEIYKRIEAAKE